MAIDDEHNKIVNIVERNLNLNIPKTEEKFEKIVYDEMAIDIQNRRRLLQSRCIDIIGDL